MEFIMWLFIISFTIIGIIGYFGQKEKNKHKSLLKETPIYWTENLGREYIVLGSVSSSYDNKYEAEIDILTQARTLGADAIICNPLAVSNHRGGSVSSSRDFNGKLKVNDTTYTSNTYHYNGSAIKFKDTMQNDTTKNDTIQISKNDEFGRSELNNLIKLSNSLREQVLQLEDNISVEIDKQKKLLDNEIINDDEYKNRINIAKTILLDKKKESEELDSKIKFKTSQLENKEEKLNSLIETSGMIFVKKENNGDIILNNKSDKVLCIVKYIENEWIISEKIRALSSEEIDWLKSYNATFESSNVTIEKSKIIIHVSGKEYKEYRRK